MYTLWNKDGRKIECTHRGTLWNSVYTEEDTTLYCMVILSNPFPCGRTKGHRESQRSK